MRTNRCCCCGKYFSSFVNTEDICEDCFMEIATNMARGFQWNDLYYYGEDGFCDGFTIY